MIGALYDTISSILQINKDLQNKTYVVVDTNFKVTELHWGGSLRGTTYTVSYEKDGTLVEINPNLKYWELTAGTHTDKVFVYALHSEIALDVYERDTKTGDGSVS